MHFTTQLITIIGVIFTIIITLLINWKVIKNSFKHDDFASLLWKLPLRFILDLIAGVQFWKNNSFSHFWMVIIAYIHFIREIEKSNKKRYQLQRLRRNKLMFPLWKSILPISYFLFGRKKFSDLKS